MLYPRMLKKVAGAVGVVLLTSVASGCSEQSAEDYMAEARAKVEQGKTKAAVIDYKNAIKMDPQAAAPRFELGKLYLENDNFASAEKELSRARELGYPASQVLPLLAQSYQQTGAENALSEVDHNTQGLSGAERVEVGFYKVEALLELEKEKQALALIEELQDVETTSVYKGLTVVLKDVINNDMKAALEKALVLYDQSPLNKDVLDQLARLHLANGNRQAATQIYKEYAGAYPADVSRQFVLVALLVDQRRLDDAEPYVDKLLKLSDTHPLLNQFKGLIAASHGEYETALSRLETAIKNGSKDPVARLVAGLSAYQLNDYDAARLHLSMIASELPDNHPGLRMLAHSMLEQGESQAAYEVMSRFEGDLESDASLLSSASMQLMREGNTKDAKALLDKSAPLSTTAEDLAKLGVLQLSLNDVEGLVNLEAAVEKAPDSVVAQSALVRAYMAAGNAEKAKKAANEWRESSPDNVEPVVMLANIAINEGALTQAATFVEEAQAIESADTQLMYTRVRLALANDDYPAAESLLSQQLENTPADVTAIAMWYALRKDRGDTANVIDYAEQQLKSASELPLRLLLARMYLAESQHQQALAVLDDVEADKQTPMLYWQLKGQLLMAKNDIDSANEHYREWLELYPQNDAAISGMIVILDAQQRYEDAEVFVEKALSKRPEARLVVLKSHFLAMQGKTDAAWKTLRSLPESMQSVPFVRGIRARLLVKEGKPREAIGHALAAYEARNNPLNAVLVAAAYELAERPQDAFEFLQKHVDAYPTDQRAAMLLAERMIPLDKNKAMTAYEAILELYPENFVVLNNLAYLYYEEDQLERAETLAQRAVELRPANADAVDTLAQIMVKQGRKQEAVELYQTISNTTIPNEQVYLNHIELLLETGNTALAKRRLAGREFEMPASQERAQALSKAYSL